MQVDQWITRVMSGEDRTPPAFALRFALCIAEPFYAQAMNLRNLAYDRRVIKSHPLPRPTISVGNITTGGTGKTPVVRWLAEHFIARGIRPAVLMRGYRGDHTGGSDEQQLLTDALGGGGTVVANPDRISGAMTALNALPQPDVFLLDDAFQHRRVRRDFNLVLMDGTNPLGFDHVLPRGMMREPARGLRRADAVIVTRSDLATSQQLQSTKARLRRWLDAGSIYEAKHVLIGARSAAVSLAEVADISLNDLSRERFYAFAGIANPNALRQQLEGLGERFGGFMPFEDHHAYTASDLAQLRQDAARCGARSLLTTEKDWVKLRSLSGVSEGIPIRRLDLRIEFHDSDEQRLLEQIMRRVEARRGEATIPATPGPWRG